MKSEKTKEKIIEQTICLIKEANGDVEQITMRKIAERSGIGVGLANHYFQSKENLIEVCVQSIIQEVIGAFNPALAENANPIETTKCVAKQVMGFLMENPQISRVSILDDLKQPKATDNTMKTVLGFGRRLSGGQLTDTQKLQAFMITAVLQEAFLRKDLFKESFGVDFYDKEQRDEFIDRLVERFGDHEVFDH